MKAALDMPSAMAAVENAFFAHGKKKVQMPPKPYLYFPKHNGDLRTMPAFLEEDDIAGVKIVNVHPENREKGLPTVMAVFVLNSTETGAPLAIMDATHLTDMRTGAAGGVAAKYLARKDSKIAGFVGGGNQAKAQLLALSENFDLECVKVYTRSIASASAFASFAGELLSCDVIISATIQDACNADIVVTTTPSREPIVKEEWISEGTHINAIGADAQGKEELDPMILKNGRVIVDDKTQAFHSGEVNVPLSSGIISEKMICCEIGEVVVGLKEGRISDSGITIFDSTGLAIQDVAAGNLVYKEALKRGFGQSLRMF
ncbi:alanine dehydrogenase [Methanohalophilus levihalophilus]|nr:alanine dehydrogenase [Methanohalophilus levihalophilus]